MLAAAYMPSASTTQHHHQATCFAMTSASAAAVPSSSSSSPTVVASSRTGIWSQEEHDRFLDAMQKFPKGPWKAIAAHIQTRSVRQVQTHAQKYQEKVERRIRGLRKRKKKIVRTEHRLLDNHVELCEIMAESEQIAPLPLSPKRSAIVDKDNATTTRKLKVSQSMEASPINASGSSSSLSPCGSPRSPSSSTPANKLERTESVLINPMCFSPSYSDTGATSDEGEDLLFPQLFNTSSSSSCAAAAAVGKKMVPLPSFGESLDFLIELFSNADPLVMV